MVRQDAAFIIKGEVGIDDVVHHPLGGRKAVIRLPVRLPALGVGLHIAPCQPPVGAVARQRGTAQHAPHACHFVLAAQRKRFVFKTRTVGITGGHAIRIKLRKSQVKIFKGGLVGVHGGSSWAGLDKAVRTREGVVKATRKPELLMQRATSRLQP